jgi:hypothetical protein
MSATEEDILNFIESQSIPQKTEEEGVSEDEIAAYAESYAPEEAQIEEPKAKEPFYQPIKEQAMGMTDSFINLLDIPNSAFDWAAEKVGSDVRVGSLRTLGAEAGIGTARGEEPDTGSYRAGEYMGMGLQFLAPILSLGKAAPLIASPGVTRGVAQTITKPFAESPKLALGAELAASQISGYGAHYGEKEFGAIGEQVGGLLGAGIPALGSLGFRATSNYIAKSFFPMSDVGSQAKAGAILRELRASPEVAAEIVTQKNMALEGTRHTSAALSKEPYLIALEKALIHDDPEFSHTLKIIDAENNAIAKVAMNKLAGEGAIEDSIKSLGSSYAKLKARLDLKVDSSLAKAHEAANKVAPKNQRKVANIEVNKQVNEALKIAREAENSIWNQVDKTAIAPTKESKSAFTKILTQRELEDDPTDIPSFLYKFLGRVDKKTGQLKGGDYADTRHVGGLQQLRSRLLQTIRAEKAGETPNWNKVRVLEEVEEAILRDMSNSNASKGLDDAIKFSRELNNKFKGDIMSVILRNNKTGGSLAPELTLESLGAGPKGAFYIKRILNASPESKTNIEDVLKMDIVQQKVVKNGVMNIQKAKDYMLRNEQTMEIFPALREDMDNAIALAEAHKYFEGSLKARMKKAESALGFSLADKTNPGTFLTKILASKNPDQTMSRVMRQVNNEGRAGIKNDVVQAILNKAEMTGELIGAEQVYKLSGTRALGYWNKNKEVLSKALSPPEQARLEKILNTLRLGEKPTDIPIDVAKAALVPKRTVLGYMVEVAAARSGAMLGAGTSGASLKTASQAANTARALMSKFDSGTAQKLLKDSIQDQELFTALSQNMVKFEELDSSFNVIQGWMVAHAVKSLEQEKEIND